MTLIKQLFFSLCQGWSTNWDPQRAGEANAHREHAKDWGSGLTPLHRSYYCCYRYILKCRRFNAPPNLTLCIWLAMAGKLCLLLLCLLCGSTSSKMQPLHQPPSEDLDFGFVPTKTYDTNAYHEPGAIGILFRLVHAFLYLVQPNHFPQGK